MSLLKQFTAAAVVALPLVGAPAAAQDYYGQRPDYYRQQPSYSYRQPYGYGNSSPLGGLGGFAGGAGGAAALGVLGGFLAGQAIGEVQRHQRDEHVRHPHRDDYDRPRRQAAPNYGYTR